MIQVIEGLPEPVVHIRATGRVTTEDYERQVIPAVRGMLARHERIRMLYELGDDFDGMQMGALWDDLRLGIGTLRSWERIAVVTDADWVAHGVAAFGWMIPGEVRVFDDDDLDAATRWVTDGIAGAG